MNPDFLVIGAAKSGTSSLDRYLAQHPDIFMPRKKEAHYFSTPDFPERFAGPGDDGMTTETIRDESAYRALFADAKPGQRVGESSAFYLYYPGTANRIHSYNPDMKLLVVLRQPVSRAWSAYMHLVRDARETLPFAQSLELEPERKQRGFEPMWLYRELGLYSEQLERYFDVFPRNQVKVILFDEFTRDTPGVMADVFAFLDVRDVPVDTGIHYNESGVPSSRAAYNFVSKPHPLKELVKPFIPTQVRERLGNQLKSKMLKKVDMDAETRAELQAYFAPEVSRLRTLLGRELPGW